MDEKGLTGPEMLEEIAAESTLDELMRRDPKTLTDEELLQLVSVERRQRALFIKGRVEKRDKKRSGG